MNQSLTLFKNPVLPESMNYEELRQKGLEYIQELGSSFWTDYNIHDPGITLLEILSYAITDIGYRTSFDIKDILAVPPNVSPQPHLQAFYSAREILTINPWTTSDFRKLLIDIDGVKNAWLCCMHCPCEMFLYADCKKGILTYTPTNHPVTIKGLYEVLVEFEEEEGFGDLNSGKIRHNFIFPTGADSSSAAMIEIRLPSWHDIEEQKNKFKAFRNATGTIKKIVVKFISGNKNDNSNIPQSELANALRRPLYVTFDIEFTPDKNNPATAILSLEDIPFSVWFKNNTDRKALQLADLKKGIEDKGISAIGARYLARIKKADNIIKDTKSILQAHRNLCEDYCTVKAIQVEDIGVCADMEIEPGSDIEKVIAECYYLIDQYFAPDIKFYSLKELLDSGKQVDEIFDGPVLNSGFIDNIQLENTQLKKTLYTSDIINLLMEVEGVISIKNMTLVRFNKEGFRVEALSWSLNVSKNHQPRFYIEGAKIQIFKNGLPFLPDRSELLDTLQVIKGANVQSKLSVYENDLPVPQGTWYTFEDYSPLQYSLPFTYGVGYEGLPQNASDQRKAQAKQLKAYMMFYEQLFVNYLKHLANIKDLFAVSYLVKHTYFSHFLTDDEVAGVNDLYNGLTSDLLQGLLETETEFHDRRNRFLDHMLARFAEQFTDYALMLYTYYDSKTVAESTLIKDKVEFLKAFPFMSSNRARAFNYKDHDHICSHENAAGLKTRIERLLGLKKVSSYVEIFVPDPAKPLELKWHMIDDNNNELLISKSVFSGQNVYEAELSAQKETDNIIKFITDKDRYKTKKISTTWVINLTDSLDIVIASGKSNFPKKSDAEAAKKNIIAFAKDKLIAEKIFIVEHLLLRPRNNQSIDFPNGDPLMPVCLPGNCDFCGEEDPYSYRLTIVMNGEGELSSRGIIFRRFAEQTIRQEVPAHLALKICWVSNKQLEEFEKVYCDWLAELSLVHPNRFLLHNKLKALLEVFIKLKSVYPPARLHDCKEGKDENPTFLDQTIV